ncbi:hypothetical protein EON65_23645 [archaeon]|nr:MAG: hypothetical protein EON65_23645 [archaeon]
MSAMLLLLALACLYTIGDSFRLSSHKPNVFRRYGGLCMTGNFDYDVIIIGCGVGGHAAALHSRANHLKTAIFTGEDVGGTCVNRGCVPSKALLAAAGRIREMKNSHHLKSFGITVGDVQFDRELVSNHASQLANRVKNNLGASLKAQGVDIIESIGQLTTSPHQVRVKSTGNIVTAKDIILAPGSVPFVPRGVTIDEKTVLTSDGALKLEYIPQVTRPSLCLPSTTAMYKLFTCLISN